MLRQIALVCLVCAAQAVPVAESSHTFPTDAHQMLVEMGTDQASCGVGEYVSTDLTICTACPANYYQDKEGAKDCISCPSGYFQDEIGQGFCKEEAVINGRIVAMPAPPPAVDHVRSDGCERGFCGRECQTQCVDPESRCQPANATFSDMQCTKDCSTVMECGKCKSGYWGPKCELTCATYNCDGNYRTECDKNTGRLTACFKCFPGWAGLTCDSRVKCPALSPPGNGTIRPSSCMGEQKEHEFACRYKCDLGYKLVGPDLDTEGRSFCDDPVPGSKTSPAASCKTIKLARPTMEDGVYYLKDGNGRDGAKYKSFCDLSIESGGWELIWKNLGGVAPAVGIQDRMLIDGLVGPEEPLTPTLATFADSFKTGSTQKGVKKWLDKGETEWMRLAQLYTADRQLVHQETVRLILPPSVSMSYILNAAKGSYPCLDLPDLIKVYVNNNYVGQTHKLIAKNGTIGIPNFDSTCGQMVGNYAYINEYNGVHFHRLDDQHSHQALMQIITTGKSGLGASVAFCDYETNSVCKGHFEASTWYARPHGDVPPAQLLVGNWLGNLHTEPTCEPKPCVDYHLENSVNNCTGRTGDRCVPLPVEGYECIGEVVCSPFGYFLPPSGVVGCSEKRSCDPTVATGCPANSACTNVGTAEAPAYQCQCDLHHFGDSSACYELTKCDPVSQIVLVEPSPSQDRVCGDRDECLWNNAGCDQKCHNTIGGYFCSCNFPGYTLSSDNHTCEPMSCRPFPVEHGANCVGKTHDECNITCNQGYYPQGQLYCTEYSVFQGNGSCVGAPCADETLFANAVTNCSGITEDVCVPACQLGYTPHGTFECETDGHFHGNGRCVPSMCDPKVPICGDSEGVPTAVKSCVGNSCRGVTGQFCQSEDVADDETASFTCATGWKAAGEYQCVAPVDRRYAPQWEGRAMCIDINECEADNGGCDHICKNHLGGFTCSCSPGYTTMGSKCIPNFCTDIRLPFSRARCQGRLGDKCSPDPIEGYVCHGTAECQSNGQWDTDTVRCFPAPCAHKQIRGASNSPATGRTGDVWFPHSIPGYHCSGSLSCGVDQSRNMGGDASCVIKSCRALQLGNGTETLCSGVHGENCLPAPLPGYTCAGELVCDADENKWVGPWKCAKKIWCDEHHLNNCSRENSICERGSCACEQGYFGTGGVCTRCNVCQDGFRQTQGCSIYHNTQCEVINPCEKNNGGCEHKCLFDSINRTATCECDFGFSKANTTSCMPSQCSRWTTQGGHCDGTTGSICVPIPEPGYECSGSKLCEPTGFFSGYASCRKLECPPLQLPGWSKPCTGSLGDHCNLKCNPHFKLTSNNSLVCAPSGHWEGGSTCERVSRESCEELLGEFITNCESIDGLGCDSSCGDAFGELTGCTGAEAAGTNFNSAEKACLDAGARLCRKQEIIDGYLTLDSQAIEDSPVLVTPCTEENIWTADLCSPGRTDMVWTVSARRENRAVSAQCAEMNTKAYGLCCADVEPAVEVNVCELGMDSCDHANGNCHYVWGEGVQCTCNNGFELLEDGMRCKRTCQPGTKFNEITGSCDCCVEGFVQLTQAHIRKGQEQPVAQHGRFDWTLATSYEVQCTRVPFHAKYPVKTDHIAVHVTSSITEYGAPPTYHPDHEAHFLWVDKVDGEGFSVCYRPMMTKRADGEFMPQWAARSQHVSVNWMAYDKLAGAIQGQLRFPEAGTSDLHQLVSCASIPLDTPSFSPHSVQHVLATANREYSTDLDTAPVTAWVEKLTQEVIEICAAEPEDMLLSRTRHLQDVVVDWVVFSDWANIKGAIVGSEPMAGEECETPEGREQLRRDADRLHLPFPCACRGKNSDGVCTRWSKGFRYSPSGTYCEDVYFRSDENELVAVPTVLLTVDHLNSQLATRSVTSIEHHEGVVAWVEWVTKRNFRVCYKDLQRHDTNAFAGRRLGWIALG